MKNAMRSSVRLYCAGHRLGWVFGALVVLGIIVVFAEGYVVPLPWLTYGQVVTVGSLCALAYALLLPLVFRNEISRLEVISGQRWRLADAAILTVLWALPWLGVLAGFTSAHFAYAVAVLLGLCVVLGRWLRVDTLTLFLLAQFIAQTALWTTLEPSPLRHALFMLSSPNPTVTVGVSAVSLVASMVFVGGFKMPLTSSP